MIKSLSFKKGVCEQLAKGEGRRRGQEGAGESNKKKLTEQWQFNKY